MAALLKTEMAGLHKVLLMLEDTEYFVACLGMVALEELDKHLDYNLDYIRVVVYKLVVQMDKEPS